MIDDEEPLIRPVGTNREMPGGRVIEGSLVRRWSSEVWDSQHCFTLRRSLQRGVGEV